MHNYTIIDTNNWKRKSSYDWFKTFSNPCYGMNLMLDVTKIIKYSKDTNTKFFINFTYILTQALNKHDPMRLRYVKGDIRLYDEIDPSYIILLDDDTYECSGIINEKDYHKFYKLVEEDILKVKNREKIKEKFNDSSDFDAYYFTCLPWIDYVSITHPIPDDLESASVPRIGWGKFKLDDKGHYIMPFNITVSHMLVDGYDLVKAIKTLEVDLENVESILK